MSSSRRPNQSGFSLVELMIALVFTAILTTGMLRVFAASVNGFYTQQETLGLQRSSRFSLNSLEEGIQEAGFLFPPRNLRTSLIESSSAQPPVLVQQADYAPVWTDPNGTSVTLPNVDELQFLQDVNLGVEGTLAAAVAPGDTSCTVTIPYGAAKLAPFASSTVPDPLVMILLDSQINQVDMLQVKTITASGGNWVVTCDPAGALPDQFGTMPGGGFFTAAFNNSHVAGSPCTFIAPLQVVRYTVVPRSLDPSNSANQVPCLVRQTAPLTANSIFHPDNATPASSQNSDWTEQIIVEGVSGLRVDLSLDGGQNFLRYNANGTLKSGMSGWSSGVYAALDSAIKDRASANPSSQLQAYWAQGLKNPLDPVWTNYLPVTFRLDVETRTRVARAEYAANQATPTAAFRTRTVTLMVSPKNYALGSLQ